MLENYVMSHCCVCCCLYSPFGHNRQLIVGDDEVKFAIKDVTSQSTPILELSSHSDFSRIMYSSDAGVLSSKTYVWTVKFSELTNGFCYWRVIAGMNATTKATRST